MSLSVLYLLISLGSIILIAIGIGIGIVLGIIVANKCNIGKTKGKLDKPLIDDDDNYFADTATNK